MIKKNVKQATAIILKYKYEIYKNAYLDIPVANVVSVMKTRWSVEPETALILKYNYEIYKNV